jgi:Sugar (and other) transporter
LPPWLSVGIVYALDPSSWCLQLAVTLGILISQLINYGTEHFFWGWRVSLGIATIPALILFIGETVSSASRIHPPYSFRPTCATVLWCYVYMQIERALRLQACCKQLLWSLYKLACHVAASSNCTSQPMHAAGGLTLPETPNSLIERGHLEEGRDVLQRIRGTENIQVLC